MVLLIVSQGPALEEEWARDAFSIIGRIPLRVSNSHIRYSKILDQGPSYLSRGTLATLGFGR